MIRQKHEMMCERGEVQNMRWDWMQMEAGRGCARGEVAAPLDRDNLSASEGEDQMITVSKVWKGYQREERARPGVPTYLVRSV